MRSTMYDEREDADKFMPNIDGFKNQNYIKKLKKNEYKL